MSMEIYSREKIVNHLENRSPSKFMYSFSRAPRFPTLNRLGKSDMFYNLPSTRMKRSTSLGFGHKSDFTKNSGGGEFISIKRDFDKGNLPGLKFSFGIARDKFRKAICPGYKIIDKDIPGPGKYNLFNAPGDDTPQFSIYEKCGSTSFINSNMNNPGPGEYSPMDSINKEGKYPISKISNIKSVNFGKNRSKRFLYKRSDVPGPGSYKLKGLMGINFNSKYNSVKLITIHKKILNKDIKDNVPGPGAYASFGEFGIMNPQTERPSNSIRYWNNIKLTPLKKKESEKTLMSKI